MTRDPHVLAPGQAPTPFTAAEIRARCAVGKTIRVLVETAGEPPYHRVTTYVECDDSGATIESERIETPLGDLDCLRYTVRDGETEKVVWFAKDIPGMPVRFLTRVDGKVAMTTSVVEHDP